MSARVLRSAGVIVFCSGADGVRRYLVLRHCATRAGSGGHWDFPKGGIKPGESDRQAAIRELREETGIRTVRWIEPFVREAEFVYRSGGTVFRKSVRFFLAEVSTCRVRLSGEHVAGEYVPASEAARRLTFPVSRELLREAEACFPVGSETTGN